MATEAGGVSLLSLAYLVEISIVLNLAYRELKFPELHDRLKTEILSVEADALRLEITGNDKAGYSELEKLRSLLASNGKFDLWRDVKDLKRFFYALIKSRLSLSIANYSILTNVILIIIFSIFSGISINSVIANPLHLWYRFANHDIPTLQGIFEIGVGGIMVLTAIAMRLNAWSLLSRLMAWALFIIVNLSLMLLVKFLYLIDFTYSSFWHISLGILIALTVLPLFFIRMATRCEVFLFGDDGKSGVVNETRSAMLEQNAIQDNAISKMAQSLNFKKNR